MAISKQCENNSYFELFERFFHAVCKASRAGIPDWRHGLLSYENACWASSACCANVGVSEEYLGQKKNIHATVSSLTQHDSTHHWTGHAPWVFSAFPGLSRPTQFQTWIAQETLNNHYILANGVINHDIAYLFQVQCACKHVKCRWPVDLHVHKQHNCRCLTSKCLNFQQTFFALCRRLSLWERKLQLEKV